MKTIYEVKVQGSTIEWSDSFSDAEKAFAASRGMPCTMYKIISGVKNVIKTKQSSLIERSIK